MSNSRLAFRPDLQGLRAIAVIAVLIFHVWPKVFKGGFVGVDVFFVISGYLITSLIVGEIEQEGRFDLLRFWGRRMLRLLPAASLVIAASLVGTLIFLPRTEWVQSAHHAMASALYAENWALVAQATDYWAQGQSPSPVQHFWSLSIEEQFYFAWPPLVAVIAILARRGRASVRTFAGVIVFVVFALSLYASIVFQPWAGTPYFTSVTRAWELALGAFIAITAPKIQPAPAVRAVFGWLGLIAVVLAIVVIDERMRFPGWVALVPTVGTALLILSVKGGGAPFSPYRLLALKPMQYIGDISYSLYLWHWPIIVFFKPVNEDFSKAYHPVIAVGLTFVLAIASKYLVEDPFRSGRLSFRRGGESRSRFIRGAFATAFAMIAVTAGAAAAMRIFEERRLKLLEEANERSYDKDPRYPGAAAFDPVKPVPVPAGVPLKPDPLIAERDTRYRFFECMNARLRCEFGDPKGKTTIALVGDSHAMSYGPALEIIAKRQGWRMIMIVKVACTIGDFPFWSAEFGYRADCDSFRERFLKWIAQDKPDFIISTGGRDGVYGGFPGRTMQIEGYRKTMEKFIAGGAKMIVLHDNPVMRNEVPKCLLWYKENTAPCHRLRKNALDNAGDNLVAATEDMKDAATINLTHLMCDPVNCPPIIGNVVVYRDMHHLTETFVRTLVPYLEKELFRVMKSLSKNAPVPVSGVLP